jgi:type I restriction-modification system DNA methylase subunit
MMLRRPRPVSATHRWTPGAAARPEELGVPNGDSTVIKNHAAFIWWVADLLRGDYEQSEYGKVIPPLTVLRRLDCVLGPTKAKVLETHARMAGRVENLEMGYLYEELIRRFSELSNETAGEHFTPREVIRLMVSLLFIVPPGG